MELVEDSIFPDRPVVYASFWSRFGALILDWLIIVIPMTILNYTVFIGHQGVYSLVNIVVSWIYSAMMESGPGMATLGKRALGIKVTDLEGNRMTFGQATGRHFAKYLSALILLIGYFMMLWDERSQTLHDKIAGAFVVMSDR